MVDFGGQQTRATLLEHMGEEHSLEAWLEFDQRYGDAIFRYARQCGMSFVDAEDVRQITYMILLAVMPRFEYDRSRGRFRGYLASVVRRAIGMCQKDGLKRAGIRVESIEGFDPAEDRVDDPVWDQEWTRLHFRIAMDQIRDSFEAVSVRVFDDLLRGLPVESIAESHGLSTDAVYKIKYRIRDRMALLISEQTIEEEASNYVQSLSK